MYTLVYIIIKYKCDILRTFNIYATFNIYRRQIFDGLIDDRFRNYYFNRTPIRWVSLIVFSEFKGYEKASKNKKITQDIFVFCE